MYHNKRVKVVTEDGRAYVRQFRNKFDIIYSGSTNTFAALASGSFALAENYLFTREAFEDYYRAMSDSGIMLLEPSILHSPFGERRHRRDEQAECSQSGQSFGCLRFSRQGTNGDADEQTANEKSDMGGMRCISFRPRTILNSGLSIQVPIPSKTILLTRLWKTAGRPHNQTAQRIYRHQRMTVPLPLKWGCGRISNSQNCKRFNHGNSKDFLWRNCLLPSFCWSLGCSLFQST